jgi:hypothetical protein
MPLTLLLPHLKVPLQDEEGRLDRQLKWFIGLVMLNTVPNISLVSYAPAIKPVLIPFQHAYYYAVQRWGAWPHQSVDAWWVTGLLQLLPEDVADDNKVGPKPQLAGSTREPGRCNAY